MMELRLPWPPKELSQNARVHWSVKARATKSYRKAAWALALAAKLKAPTEGKIYVQCVFQPPKNWSHGDEDNLLARMKAGFDGIADALKVNDSRFHIHPPSIPTLKNNCVIVHVNP